MRFDTKLEDISISGGRVTSVTACGGQIAASAVVLALGHSARDTFEMLAQKGAKPLKSLAEIQQERVSRREEKK